MYTLMYSVEEIEKFLEEAKKEKATDIAISIGNVSYEAYHELLNKSYSYVDIVKNGEYVKTLKREY